MDFDVELVNAKNDEPEVCLMCSIVSFRVHAT